MTELKAQEWREASKALLYEIEMLINTASALIENELDTGSSKYQLRNNAFFESFLIHMRQLTYFLCYRDPNSSGTEGVDISRTKPKWTLQDDDLKPNDYVSTVLTYEPPYISDCPKLNDAIKYANKHLAHLTRVRKEAPPPVDVSAIANNIINWFYRFLCIADNEKLDRSLLQLKNEWARKVPVIYPPFPMSTAALPEKVSPISLS